MTSVSVSSPPLRLTLLLLALSSLVAAEPQAMFGYILADDQGRPETSLDFYAPSDRGCALCRNEENCSLAVHNQSTGVFCGDVLATFQPCCCSFRNECMTSIYLNSCVCYDGAREKEMVTTRFYLFVGLSIITWGFLLYDRMCKGPYKVMNSNRHQLLSSPSAARARGVDTIADTVESESEEEEGRDGVAAGDDVAVDVAEMWDRLDKVSKMKMDSMTHVVSTEADRGCRNVKKVSLAVERTRFAA
uniref:RxLR effector candidate protein n=1 Tax=Hyaloperonospora arabidopsidis (strain Emoy2) TaxID=559515 RepID=M4BTG5_HYAAE